MLVIEGLFDASSIGDILHLWNRISKAHVSHFPVNFFFFKKEKMELLQSHKVEVSLTEARPPSVHRGFAAVRTGAPIGYLKGLDDSHLLRDHKALNSQSRWKALRRVGPAQERRPRGIFIERHVRITVGLWWIMVIVALLCVCRVGHSGLASLGWEHVGEITIVLEKQKPFLPSVSSSFYFLMHRNILSPSFDLLILKWNGSVLHLFQSLSLPRLVLSPSTNSTSRSPLRLAHLSPIYDAARISSCEFSFHAVLLPAHHLRLCLLH